MSVIVLLDAGPLGMVTNPKSSPENEACKNWLASLPYKGIEVVIPEIADYEVRRELLRAGKDRGIGRLDALKGMLGYAAVSTPVMPKAAEFWAIARNTGRQPAADASPAKPLISVDAGATVLLRFLLPQLSMNRLDYNRLALSAGSPTPSRTPRFPPPLRASALN
jgi:hypothetical protein